MLRPFRSCAWSWSWLISVFDGLGDLRRAAQPPPREDDQQRKGAEEPQERGPGLGDQWVAGVLLPRGRRRNRPSCQRVEQRQNHARAGRSTLVRATRAGIVALS